MADGWKIQCTRQIGEHLIAAELGRRGFVASPFAGNVPVFDLLAADQAGFVVPVQVKAINGGDWQFNASTYLVIQIEEHEQTMLGTRKLLNPNVVCVFVVLQEGSPDDMYVLLLSDLQELIRSRYKPRKAPQNVKSVHCALRQKDLLPFKERWRILDDAFEAVKKMPRRLAN